MSLFSSWVSLVWTNIVHLYKEVPLLVQSWVLFKVLYSLFCSIYLFLHVSFELNFKKIFYWVKLFTFIFKSFTFISFKHIFHSTS